MEKKTTPPPVPNMTPEQAEAFREIARRNDIYTGAELLQHWDELVKRYRDKTRSTFTKG